MSKFAPLAPVIALLAACGGGASDEEGNRAAAAPTPASTLPPPRTPVIEVTPAPGNEASWLEPRAVQTPSAEAPYGNLLDQPVATTGK